MHVQPVRRELRKIYGNHVLLLSMMGEYEVVLFVGAPFSVGCLCLYPINDQENTDNNTIRMFRGKPCFTKIN